MKVIDAHCLIHEIIRRTLSCAFSNDTANNNVGVKYLHISFPPFINTKLVEINTKIVHELIILRLVPFFYHAKGD